MRFIVRAPASSANLGPGFDALGLALDLWNEIEVDTATDHETVAVSGADAAMLEGKENYTLLAMKEMAQLYGRTLPPVAMRVRADIPVQRGLGSSAAALACGLLAANRMLDLQLTTTDLFQQAWQMEGHGDNVGAAIYGGAILAVAGVRDALCLSNGRGIQLTPVVFIPAATSATWAARAALPLTIPHPDAAFNVGMAAGLSVGLVTGNREAIAAGMHDRLHEPYRARLFPHLTPMTEAARAAGALGACLSGAGPTILALVEPERVEAVADAFRDVAREHEVPGSVQALPIADRGAHIIDCDE